MPSRQKLTQQRLIQAAFELFTSQGIADTTTRQIAELAEVNEVTLFRHFGNKHGLLLAVLKDSAIFTDLGRSLNTPETESGNFHQALRNCTDARLKALERAPEFVRSIVGEAGQYSGESRRALGQGLNQANHYTAQYLSTVIHRTGLQPNLPVERLAGLLNGLLLGYAVINFTSDAPELWGDREEFLRNLVTLFLQGAVSPLDSTPTPLEFSTASTRLANWLPDLPAALVHTILQRAKKSGLRDYALIYLLFATGLAPQEIVRLQRSQHLSQSDQQLLHVQRLSWHTLPLNRWILGKRYGFATSNPLTQWLKSRRDSQLAMFVDDSQQPISEATIHTSWQNLTTDLVTPEGWTPVIEQAQQTWCVEMLMRGLSPTELATLTGWDLEQIHYSIVVAEEKAVLERAIRSDQKQ